MPHGIEQELASTCLFIAGVACSLRGDHRRRVGVVAHNRAKAEDLDTFPMYSLHERI